VTTIGGDTLIDAVVAVARADEKVWRSFRCHVGRICLHGTDYPDHGTEKVLRDWFCPSSTLRAIDGWAKQYILDVLSDALAGRCRLRGFIGLKEVEIPAGIFLSTRLVNELSADGESFWKNEIKLPDGDLVVGVTVSWGDRGISSAPHPHSTDPDDPKEAAVHEWLMSRHKLEKRLLKITDKALRKECMEKFSISWRQYDLIFRGLPADVRHTRGGIISK
jgi:hypothetical protein